MPFTARHLPPEDSGGGWLEPLAPAPESRRVEGERRYDFAVIGAGFTGLSAARRLSEIAPGARIAAVDARRAGYGASGRSSGFIVDLAGFIAAMRPDHGERFIRLSRAGIEELRCLVAAHRIECAWDERGFFHVAAGTAGMRSLTALRGWLERRGERFEWHDAPAMEGVTGTAFYRAGLRLPGSILVQAGALVRGLAAHLPAEVDLFEESPVGAIRGRGPYEVEAGGGKLVAERLILALNGYAPGLGALSRRVVPLITFASLTRRLSASERAELGGESEWGLLAQDPMGSSVRRTRDQRLLIRNYVCYEPGMSAPARALSRALELHRQALARRFPAFAELELEYSWAGIMGTSRNQFPFFGRLAPGLLAAGGYSGAGIAMGTIHGRLLAELAVGVPSPLLEDQLALPGPRYVPPAPLRDIAVRTYVARMNASADETL